MKPFTTLVVVFLALIALAQATLYTLLQILSVNIFEKMRLQQTLTENARSSNNLGNPNQLNLPGV